MLRKLNIWSCLVNRMQNKIAVSFREEINPLKWWNSSNIWEQLKQMKVHLGRN
jgi:hypothetical protein